jgi:hypothetical protein
MGWRTYVINWPEIQDNAVLSADEKTLTARPRPLEISGEFVGAISLSPPSSG